jgi:spermidine/putrescine transport system ATP-binding protein
MSEVILKVESLHKFFGDNHVLRGIDLEVRRGQTVCMIGSSGSGKSTFLRCINFMEYPSAGRLTIHGKVIGREDGSLEGAPVFDYRERELVRIRTKVGMVFQQFNLFPHMKVLQNVMEGLVTVLNLDKEEAASRARANLSKVGLLDKADQYPSRLSGGQQQRVALARALAPSPKVLLLDEPLSALDLKLRQAMRVELKQIQEETGITFVFVTHDQEEALTMSDRIAVMSNGELQQIGSAQEIYEQPRNQFVAGFIGETNLFDVIIEDIQEDQAICRIGGTCISCTVTGSAVKGSTRQISIRPERLSFTSSPEDGQITGVVERLTYLGTDTQYLVQLNDGTKITVRSQNARESGLNVRSGERIGLKLEKGGARLLMS